MEDPTTFVIFFSGIWAFLGAIFLVIGIAMNNNRKKKESKCTSKTIGKVIDIARNSSSTSDGGYSTTWSPVIEYTIGELKYKKEYPFSSSNARYAIGQDVEVFYNPEDPHEYYIAGDKIHKILSIVFTSVGVGAICIAIISAVCILSLT